MPYLPVLQSRRPLPLVGGLDLSLTATGIAWAGAHTGSTKHGQEGITKLRLPLQLEAITRQGARILEILLHPPGYPHRTGRIKLVMIEAPDLSSSFGGLQERIRLHHEVETTLWRAGIPFAHLPSGLLKGYGTGHGGSLEGKKRVVDAVTETWPEYCEQDHKIDHNEADAIILAQAGLHWLTGTGRVADSHFAYLERPTAKWWYPKLKGTWA